MSPPGVSGIVLAGGRSSRFGGDKLAARLGGETLLDRAVAALAPHCSEIVVVLAAGDERSLAPSSVPIRRTIDPEPFGGPLIGLLAGLEAAREPIVLLVAGDMPTLSGDVLAALVRTLVAAEGSASGAALVQRGVTRPFPSALRNGATTQTARRLIADGERSLRSMFDVLPTRRLMDAEWRGLDPEEATLRDIDHPDDLPAEPRK